MKKIFYSILFITFLIPAPLTFGDTFSSITLTETPNIPIINGKASNKPIEFSIADFNYTLEGDISSASIEGQWGGKKINKISKLDLYLDDILLIDFGQYFMSLSKSDKRALIKSLRRGEMIVFDINIDEEDFEELEDGEAFLYLVGKPKFFRSLRLDEITLTIVDPLPSGSSDTTPVPEPPMMPPLDEMPPTIVDPLIQVNGGTTPVPEPATMLLIGSGLAGLWGFRKKFRK